MPEIFSLATLAGLGIMDTVTPAVTCSAQATFMTGTLPQDHGIVGNGWLFRDQMEVLLWRQSNRLVGGEKIWEAGKKRDGRFTCANMFWWYNMASSHDVGATPRPIYKADGRKLPDCYTVPAQLRERLTERLGPFPLFQFWGPATTIASTRWIAEATKLVMTDHDPTLTLVYLPHLDYDLQRFGPDETHPAVRQSLIDIDAVAGDLADAARESADRSLSSPNMASRLSNGRCISTGRCVMQVSWLSARKTAVSCSIRWHHARSRCPTTRSHISTSPIRDCCRKCEAWLRACPASSISMAALKGGQSDSIMSALAS